jgi:hypothetical protein
VFLLTFDILVRAGAYVLYSTTIKCMSVGVAAVVVAIAIASVLDPKTGESCMEWTTGH